MDADEGNDLTGSTENGQLKISFSIQLEGGVHAYVEVDNLADMTAVLQRGTALPAKSLSGQDEASGSQNPAPGIDKPKRASRKASASIAEIGRAIGESVASKAEPAVAAPNVAPVVQATEKDVVDAVKKLAAAKGVPAVHVVFAEFKVKRASEITAEQRSDFLAAVAKAAA